MDGLRPVFEVCPTRVLALHGFACRLELLLHELVVAVFLRWGLRFRRGLVLGVIATRDERAALHAEDREDAGGVPLAAARRTTRGVRDQLVFDEVESTLKTLEVVMGNLREPGDHGACC